MAAFYANTPTTVPRGMKRAFWAVAQLFLIMAIFSAKAQEFLDSNELSQSVLNNEITPSTNSARRFARYEGRRNLFRTKENCKNSADCASNEWILSRPKVSYHDAYRFRAQQCAEFDKRSYNGKNIKWRPYFREQLDECKLYCLADGHKFYARLKNAVNDGTPCGKHYSNVCIKGKCQKRPSGCQALDGPCLVDERKKILGVFNSTRLNIGYNLVATIPAGATNITIEELTRSRSYLALKDHESGTYHLNGHWMISLSKTFQLATSHVTYTRNGNTRRGGEVITINGPLDKSLDIMVVYQRDPSIVMYSYLVTKDEYKKRKHQSRIAGEILYFPNRQGNSQPTRQTQNNGQAPQTSSQEGESISFEGGSRQEPDPNNGGETEEGDSISFVSGQRQTPNASTGGQGFSYPHLSTAQRQSSGGEQSERGKQWHGSSWVQFGGDKNSQSKQTSEPSIKLASRPLLKQQVYKPKQFGNSKLPQYPSQAGNPVDGSQGTSYQRDRWGSTVPNSQGRAWQTQNDKKQFYTSNQEQNDGVQAFVWRMVGFTSCSSSCAGGIQSGIVKCTRATTGENVAENKCDQRTRLQETRRACNLSPCPASWAPQEWQACSKTCGEGEQVRDLMCKQTIDRNGEKVTVMLPVAQCPVPLRPEVVRKCVVKECPEQAKPQWTEEDWGQCSVECSHGVRKRNIACKNYKNETVADSQCAWMRKPVLLKACYLGLCKADWYMRSDWSQCSRTCGSGISTRVAVCARIGGSKLAEKHCQGKSEPEHERSCNTHACKGIWVASDWSKCSTDCGKGLQQRVVICMKTVFGSYRETLDADCSLDDKLVVRKECNIDCGPSWFSTTWTQCSVTCGQGVQTRRVSCLNANGKRVGGCKTWERPVLRRACNLKTCPGTKVTRSNVPSTCKDNPPRSFKRYCHIIKRINYCRIESYRKRCCATCEPSGTIFGRHI